MQFKTFLELRSLSKYHAILLYSNQREWHGLSVAEFCQCLEKICNISFTPSKNDPFSDDFYHPDILIIDRTRARLRLEDIQEVKNFCLYPPQIAKKRLVFIQNCERLNTHSGNAILKILEEPHEGVVFLFSTERKHLILNTILSRMQSFCLQRENRTESPFFDRFDPQTHKIFEIFVNSQKNKSFLGSSLSDPKSFSIPPDRLSKILNDTEQITKQYSPDQIRDLLVYWISDRLKKDKTFVMMARFMMAQLRDWKKAEPLNPSSQFWLIRIFLGQSL